jgi:hypothetical protein
VLPTAWAIAAVAMATASTMNTVTCSLKHILLAAVFARIVISLTLTLILSSLLYSQFFIGRP